MDDLQATRLCAEAMGLRVRDGFGPHGKCLELPESSRWVDDKGEAWTKGWVTPRYDPLTDDAQDSYILDKPKRGVQNAVIGDRRHDRT